MKSDRTCLSVPNNSPRAANPQNSCRMDETLHSWLRRSAIRFGRLARRADRAPGRCWAGAALLGGMGSPAACLCPASKGACLPSTRTGDTRYLATTRARLTEEHAVALVPEHCETAV